MNSYTSLEADELHWFDLGKRVDSHKYNVSNSTRVSVHCVSKSPLHSSQIPRHTILFGHLLAYVAGIPLVAGLIKEAMTIFNCCFCHNLTIC